MTRPLALHQITAMAADPVALLSIAAEIGCQSVCVFTHLPNGGTPFPAIHQGNKTLVQQRMADTGVGISNIEYFPIGTEFNLESCRPALALGAELGARRAVVHDTDQSRALDALGRLSTEAGQHGLSLGLEFMGLTPGCTSIHQAARYVEQLGTDNIGIAVDALHLVRTGGTPADVAALPASMFSYAQICDGAGLHQSSAYLPEAMHRQLPGRGDFPLLSLIEALPASIDLDVEIPQGLQPEAGSATLTHACEAVRLARELMQRAQIRR